MDYILHLSILICFYTLLGQSLNLLAGFSGLISLAHASFYGVGAYTTAILSTRFGFSFWLNLPLGILICCTIALLVSFTALRTVGDYFVICTLGVQVVLFSLMNNLTGITNGPLGITRIPSITFGEIILDGKISFLLLSLFFMTLGWFILSNIARSGFGNILIALSEDEIYSQSIGKNVNQAKVISFTVSAIFASIPGTLYSHYIGYIDPTSFTVNESIFILSIVLIGGLRSLMGSFVAATFLVLLPEVLRLVGMPDTIAANMRQIIYGIALVAIIMKGKNGLKEFLFFK